MRSKPRNVVFPKLHFERSLLGFGCSLDHVRSVLSNIEDPDWESNAERYRFSGTRCVEALPTTGPAVYWEMEVRVLPQNSLARVEEIFCTVGVATDSALHSCDDEEGFVVTDHSHRPGVTTVLRVQGSSVWGLSSIGERRVSNVEVVECQPAGTTQTTTVELGFLWNRKKRRIFVINLQRLETILQASLQVGEPLFFAGEVESTEVCDATVEIRLRTGLHLKQLMSGDKLKFIDDLLNIRL